MTKPRVAVSSGGVFHAYHVARGAYSAGYLLRFITTRFSRFETGIPRDRVVELPLSWLLAWGMTRLPGNRVQALSYDWGDRLFDTLASRRIADADIVHVFNHHGLYTMRQAKQRGALTIVERCSAHPQFQADILTEEFARYGLTYPTEFHRLIPRHVAEFDEADAIMVCSDFVRRTMRDAGIPDEKMLSVHLGFDPERFSAGPKHDDVFRVIFAGGLSLQKGLPYLIEAFKRLNLPNSELLLVGKPYPEAEVFLKPYAGLYRHVDFVPQHELARFFQQGSVFVLPSIQDGFGMVVYEAAACGLPVIISDHVGADITPGEHGFVVPIRDPDALAERLQWFYDHPTERAAMGQAVMQFVQQFTWQNYHRELVGHYDTLWAAR